MRTFGTILFFMMGGASVAVLVCPQKFTPGVTYTLMAIGAIAGLCFGLGVLMATDRDLK